MPDESAAESEASDGQSAISDHQAGVSINAVGPASDDIVALSDLAEDSVESPGGSDGYEPPEPDRTTPEAEGTFTPPFSPAPPTMGPLIDMSMDAPKHPQLEISSMQEDRLPDSAATGPAPVAVLDVGLSDSLLFRTPTLTSLSTSRNTDPLSLNFLHTSVR